MYRLYTDNIFFTLKIFPNFLRNGCGCMQTKVPVFLRSRKDFSPQSWIFVFSKKFFNMHIKVLVSLRWLFVANESFFWKSNIELWLKKFCFFFLQNLSSFRPRTRTHKAHKPEGQSWGKSHRQTYAAPNLPPRKTPQITKTITYCCTTITKVFNPAVPGRWHRNRQLCPRAPSSRAKLWRGGSWRGRSGGWS